MELGFHLWVYCQLELREQTERDLAAALAKVGGELLGGICRDVATAGFQSIETMANMLETDEGEASHRVALAESGLRFLGFSNNAAYWDPSARAGLVEYLDAICERAARLGGEHLGVSATPVPGRAKSGGDWDEEAETLRQINQVARRHGVRTNLHTYDRYATDDFREVRELVARLGQDELELGPDLAWLRRGGGDPVAFLEEFGSRVTFCHVRDSASATEWAEAAGEGIEDFAAQGEAWRRSGCTGPVVFEPAFPDWAPTRPLPETLRLSAEHLRQAFAG